VALIATFVMSMAGFFAFLPGLGSASAAVPDPVDLALTKSDDGLVKMAGGDSFDYTITIENVGSGNVALDAPVTVTDDLPAGLVFVSFPANCAQAGQTLTCSIDPADLDAYGGPVVIIVTVRAPADTASDAYTNVAYVDSPQDPACEGYGCVPVCDGYSNNIDCESTTIERPQTPVVHEADVSIDKSVSQSTVVAGNQFNWFLAVTNHGPDTATGLVINDTMPAQFEVTGVFPPAGMSCSNNVGMIVCTADSLLIDQTVTIQVQVRVKNGVTPGLVANTGTVTAETTDLVPANNTDTASTTITAVASEAPVPAAQPPAAVSPQLPATGNRSLGGPLSLAGLLCGAGIVTLIVARRRRFADA
jgi:uncharacterized repeat protein (TIGR01451 family)